ncbi:DEAD/DEAH box helicase family protein [Afifella marina]|uniref:Type I restriction enzyme, R subunit n=2 Tax=Hyphomicrobiales TaxID=356 RepID=A0A1G5NHE7_AFIMA|nr:DEAD/DEAH box helicase family protein [Afifella marina]MBK1623500.1 restriction endonuclease subunit R [Afifella marina DSM 2698]MBK1626493.1 restriction endonuclease subunit R [Afifella marina]MBK5916042.1 restriction endonuclease subunit R [Afifella marina]RAI18353.1 restriction endonuclease subunit R [Afifella marina DSM 2698]SCZ36812.1 type I restriction enzyme, R subunit [Afifella marina DSM 2698]
MSNFAFLAAEFPTVHEPAAEAERQAKSSPTAAAFFAGKAVEVAVKWAFLNDPGLRLPYQDNIAALLHEPSFKRLAGEAVFAKARYINRLRNRAVHEEKPISEAEAFGAVQELFHVAFWFARTYARGARPPDGLAFDPTLLTRREAAMAKAFAHIKAQQEALEAKDGELAALFKDKENLDEELKRVRAEVAATRDANEKVADGHDYGEAETRDRFIDLLLKEAGWGLDKPEDIEFEVTGMPNEKGLGYVDYVLWGGDGRPLGLVEAKRTRHSPEKGRQQAKLYADCLEKRFGQRPVIFLSNGYEHWIWDDTRYPPREIGGFYKKGELELLIQRRTSRKTLSGERIDRKIVERPYQQRAIRAITKNFEEANERKALLVMATGAGKTRTVIALVDLMMRAGWVKRVLFLADRVSLVRQATNAFKKHLPDSAPVNLVTERTAEGRVFLSTYPTMMNLIDGKAEGTRAFGPGHFDLVVIDEAHRSVYQRYRAIFDYFDSFLVGLTATPKDEIDRNTYSLFDLEDGVPTDAYSLDEAVADGHLVPPQAVSVPLKIIRSGLRYDELSDEEKDQWDMLEWGEEEVPDSVEAAEINKRLFNEDTVDRVIAHFMEKGVKVVGGDRLGKTIIFAKNQDHAEFIEKRFNIAYPELAGHFARVITYKVDYAQSLIDAFSINENEPHIAISVDMLDTGIDVPEVVNLVFFKLVRSKTKFWQMMGRGTRLCPDLFGPGEDKEFFRVFDYCGNLEFFGANPEITEPSLGKSLSERLFAARLDLVRGLDEKLPADGMGEGEQAPFEGPADAPPSEAEIRADALGHLQETVAGMNLDSFTVRQKRRLVEKYQKKEAWLDLNEGARAELVDELAPLPSSKDHGTEGAKRFDLLMFQLELALLKGSKRFDKLKKKLLEIASALEDQTAIPGIAAQAELIESLQTDAWWEGVNVSLLEFVRFRLRNLVEHIERRKKSVVYSNFADEIGADVEIDLPQVGEVDFARFKRKARAFLQAHEDHIALHKLRHGKPLTATDLAELEAMLVDAGIGDAGAIARAKETSEGFGLFVRSLVGLDREAVNAAFSDFIADGSASAEQIEFIDMVVEHLTRQGVMAPELLYESPFTDVAPSGPEAVFDIKRTDRLFEVIKDFNESAVA